MNFASVDQRFASVNQGIATVNLGFDIGDQAATEIAARIRRL
jgi:hypothetical protein